MMRDQGKHGYIFGEFRLDPRERLLFADKEVIALTPKAFDTLLVLVENSGHVLSKDELMAKVWPDSFVEENNLAQNISALRKALGEDGSGHKYIETVPKRGYRFIADVFPDADQRASPATGQQRKTGHDERQHKKDKPLLRDVVFIGRAIDFKSRN